jgi:hypothetical protein
MFDESRRLQENSHLLALLSHYAQQGTADRATWRDRLMQMDGVEPRQLSTLHGDLIAFDWLEQNIGGSLSACYRITLSGLREYGKFHGVEINEKSPEAQEKRFPRKKKRNSDAPVILEFAAAE